MTEVRPYRPKKLTILGRSAIKKSSARMRISEIVVYRLNNFLHFYSQQNVNFYITTVVPVDDFFYCLLTTSS